MRENAIVLDTSVLLEILMRTPYGVKVTRSIYYGEYEPHTTYLNLAESIYILCRRLGYEEAWKRLEILLDSGYFIVHDLSEIYRYIGECKCRFPISLADCTSLSLAKLLNKPILFFKVEEEFKGVLKELEEWLGLRILFLMK